MAVGKGRVPFTLPAVWHLVMATVHLLANELIPSLWTTVSTRICSHPILVLWNGH